MTRNRLGLIVEVALVSLLVGSAFNSVVAFISLFFPYIVLATAGLTGFGIVTLAKQFLQRNKP